MAGVQRSDIDRCVMRVLKGQEMEIEYTHGDEGRDFYTRGHVPLDEFMTAVASDCWCGENDPILNEQPTHCWMRVCRDFNEGHSILVEAAPNSRGAFRATWLQDA